MPVYPLRVRYGSFVAIHTICRYKTTRAATVPTFGNDIFNARCGMEGRALYRYRYVSSQFFGGAKPIRGNPWEVSSSNSLPVPVTFLQDGTKAGFLSVTPG